MIYKSRNVITTDNFNEIGTHGSPTFPVAAYDNDFTQREAIWHWHREFEIIHVIEGSLAVLVPNEKLILQKGDVIFINSEVMHSAANAGISTCLLHSAVFLPELLCNGLTGIFWYKYIYPLMCNQKLSYSKIANEAAKDLMSDFRVENLTEMNGYEFKVREILTKLILTVISAQEVSENVQSIKKQRDEERIRLMLQYVHNHYMEELTVQEIASCANISESECLRCFRSSIGTTPVQYLKRYRLEIAADYLSTTTKSVTEIATSCGFNHMSYFSKAFFEMYSVLPREYRNKQRHGICRCASPK